MSGKRIDPEDGEAYTWDDIAAHYKGKYKKKDVEAYWDTMKPAKGKGKGAAKAIPKGGCSCCGKEGHKKADCPMKDKTCSICGKVGHLKVMCKQAGAAAAPASKAKAIPKGGCTCCGKADHKKADCPMKDKTCSLCGKVGHLKAVCRSADAGGGAKAKAKAKPKKKEKKERKPRPEPEEGTPAYEKRQAYLAKRRCRNCQEQGHVVADCPQPKMCAVCMSKEHERKDCPKKNEPCPTCGKKGHVAETCRQKDKPAEAEA